MSDSYQYPTDAWIAYVDSILENNHEYKAWNELDDIEKQELKKAARDAKNSKGRRESNSDS